MSDSQQRPTGSRVSVLGIPGVEIVYRVSTQEIISTLVPVAAAPRPERAPPGAPRERQQPRP